VTETWQSGGDNSHFSELSPPIHTFFYPPSLSGRGGGLATVFRVSFCCRIIETDIFTSFKVSTIFIGLDELVGGGSGLSSTKKKIKTLSPSSPNS